LARFARLTTGCSILFGYPLVVVGARQAIQGLLADTSFGLSMQSTVDCMFDRCRLAIHAIADRLGCGSDRLGLSIQGIVESLGCDSMLRRIHYNMPATALHLARLFHSFVCYST
jgi:hypothetical protein